jgi:predicted nuclease with TOPRIM domain
MNLYKEEMKNLHYNIQDIYRDQKKLIFKYDTDANKWEIKFEELSNEIEQLTKENKILKKNIDDSEMLNKELKNKNTDLNKENSDLKNIIFNNKNEISDITLKFAEIKKDYELTLIDKNKILELNKNQKSEI